MTFFGGEAEDGLASGIGRGASRDGNERGQKRDTDDRALALLRQTFQELGGSNPARRHADAPEWQHDLYECVRRVRTGVACDVVDLADTPAATFVDKLRSAYLANARRDRSVNAGEVLDVLAALERVGNEMRRERLGDFAAPLAHDNAPAAIVEVAHDMRSPLNAIMLLVRLVLDDRELRAERAQQLGIVYSAAFGLNALVNDLVDSVKPAGRLLEPAPIPLSLAETLQSVRDIVAPVAAEKGLQLRIVAPRGARRLGHPTALHRVLLNLATNALKYTDSGSVTVAARELSRTRLEFSVSDTGRGMTRRQLAKLFGTPSRDALGARQRFSSAGLGLAFCRALVASMGGRITAESAEGRGTTFRVELEMPVEQKELQHLVPEPWRDELAGDLAPTGSGVVLAHRPLRVAPRAD